MKIICFQLIFKKFEKKWKENFDILVLFHLIYTNEIYVLRRGLIQLDHSWLYMFQPNEIELLDEKRNS